MDDSDVADIELNPGPKDPSVLHLQVEHRAQGVLPDPRDSRIIFRNRQKLALIDDSDFFDVQHSPSVASQLFFVKRYKTTFHNHYHEAMKSKTVDQLSDALFRFQDLLEGDRRSSYRISGPVAMSLVRTLKKFEYDKFIQSQIITILSHARFDVCGAVIKDHIVPILVNRVSDSYTRMSRLALIALTHLLVVFPKHMNVLIDGGALEAAHEEIKAVRSGYTHKASLANFLAAFCRGYSLSSESVSSDKVGFVLTMLVDLFQNKEFAFIGIHTARACYALSYLSYGRCLDFEVNAWNLLVKKLTEFISLADTSGSRVGYAGSFAIDKNIDQMVAGSALGVVGNIARWGTMDQIRSLIKNHELMRCLRSLLRSEFKKFRREACQIISNISALSETLMKDMVDKEIVELLCHMLEKDEPEMKMEAAWAVYVGICGCFKYEEIEASPKG
ncbi:hypothetical protein POM88_014020 [Heracleum sosnowskyi]|uniref:Uncharacterized protein n=1 Tax=Heracleum sosnowskyi TaxID=360622 RepID=A0AAD8J178_9APIA|nr:hypothetical protein POM88_014020 [Heracleum sosnowskyi]